MLRSCDLCSLQRRLAQVGANEVGTDEMSFVKVEMFELGFAEISNHFWMTVYPAVPGLSSLAQQFEVVWVSLKPMKRGSGGGGIRTHGSIRLVHSCPRTSAACSKSVPNLHRHP